MRTEMPLKKITLAVTRWTLPAGLALAIVAARTSGQNGPPPKPAGGGEPPMQDPGPGGPAGPGGDRDSDHGDHGGRRGVGPRGGGMGGQMGGPGGGQMGGPGGMNDGGRGPNWAPTLMAPQMQQVERMRGYLELVDKFAALSRDPSASGVAAVITAGDVLRSRGADAAIKFYTDILPKVSDRTVQCAIHVQLAEMYRSSGKSEQALSELAYLMTGKPETITLPPATQPSR